MGYTLNFAVIWANFDKLLWGLLLGLSLALASVGIGAVIGLVGGFASSGSNRIARGIVATYVAIIRNTPILVIVLLIYLLRGSPPTQATVDALSQLVALR